MHQLAALCVRRPVLATVMILVILVLGLFGYRRLGVDEFPTVDLPVVTVTTILPGAAPAEMESNVTDKIEAAVNTIAGVEELRSTSSEGVSMVMISFDFNRQVDGAAQDVRDKVGAVISDLPDGVMAPLISKLDLNSAPVLLLALRADRPYREISEVADKQVRRHIESVAGVGQVSLIGARNRTIHVRLDPLKLKSFGMASREVAGMLAAQNMSLPGGSLDVGPTSLNLRIDGRVTSVEELGAIVIRQVEGRAIRLSDVAEVEDGEAAPQSLAQLDDEQTVVLAVRKQSGRNTVAVVDAVKERLREVQQGLPPGYAVDLVRDDSQVIRTGTDAVFEHLLLGAFLAALVVLLFLGNLPSTIIAGLTIPVSVTGTFAIMWWFGHTLNFLTLLALALAVGIVIDDAIVVLENIVRHIEHKGLSPKRAAVEGTREIAPAVMATTLSLLVVFLPVAFVPGMGGKMLGPFAFTMAFAIVISMFVGFTLTPMLASRWLRVRDPGAAPGRLERLVDLVYRPMERIYMRMLTWSMAHRWVIVLASLATLATLGPLKSMIAKGFMPPVDKAMFEMSVRAPEGTSLEETRLITERVARQVRRYPNVVHTLIMVASDFQQTPNLARIQVFLTDPRERSTSQLELMEQVRREVVKNEPAAVTIKIENPQIAGVSPGVITYALSGPDLTELNAHAEKITAELRGVHGAVDVGNTLVGSRPEVQIRIDRERAASLGVNVADISMALRLFVAGAKVSSYAEGGEEYDVRLQGAQAYRATPEALGELLVPSRLYGTVPLSAVVTTAESSGPAVINRIGRRRQVTISAANSSDVGSGAIVNAIVDITAAQHLPPEYRLEPIGETKETEKIAASFSMVLLLAFVLMYLVLAAQFESWIHPFTILITLPLTVPFAFVSLLVMGQSLSMFSGLGLLVLFGVVKKNAILQVDHTNQLRAEGKPRLEAILEANRDRFRPIMMTTLAFVVGMLPLAVARGIGAGFSHATSAIVIGGQTLSLLLTLLAAPVIYSLLDDAGPWLKRVVRRPPAVPPTPVV